MNLSKTKSNSKVLIEKTSAEVNLLQKLKPRQINIDKERLYEENLELKLKNNSLKEENTKLKTKIHQAEKELSKKDENEEKISYSAKPSNTLSSLKSKIKDLKSKVLEKEEEIDKLNRTLKSSKIQELEKEISVYTEECLRLKKIIKESVSPNENIQKILTEKYFDINSMIEDMNKENKDLHKSIGYYKQELDRLKQKLTELERKKKKQPSKSEADQLKTEIIKLKELNESLSVSVYEGLNKEKLFRDEIMRLKKSLKDAQLKNQLLETSLKDCSTISHLSTNKQLKTENISQESNISEPLPLMVKTVRLALSRSGQTLEAFFSGLDKLKTGKVSYDDFSQALQKLGTYLTNSHFNSVPTACIKSEYLIDLNVLSNLINESQKILLVDSKEHTPVTNTFDFESPVNHPGKVHIFPPLPNPETKLSPNPIIQISLFPPVDNTKQLNSDSCKNSKRSKQKKFENFISDDDSKSRGKKSSKTSEKRKTSKRKSKDSEEKSTVSVPTQEPVSSPELLQALSHVSFKMQMNRLPKSKLLITLFGVTEKEKIVSRLDLQNYLEKSPFFFKDPAIVNPIVFYFISPGCTIRGISDKLMNILPDWEILSPEDEELFDYELGLIISKNKEMLKSQCKAADAEKKGSISLTDFEKILKKAEIIISDRLWKYIKLLFYSNDSKLDSVPYRYFIKAYGNPVESRGCSIGSESQDQHIINFFLSAINSALIASNLTLNEVFDSDHEGLINCQQFISGLQALGFEDIDRDQVNIVMEGLKYQGSKKTCLSIEELNDILQTLALGRLSSYGSSDRLGDKQNSEESQNFGIIKLIKNESFEESPTHLSI